MGRRSPPTLTSSRDDGMMLVKAQPVIGDGVRRQVPGLPADDSYGTLTQESFCCPKATRCSTNISAAISRCCSLDSRTRSPRSKSWSRAPIVSKPRVSPDTSPIDDLVRRHRWGSRKRVTLRVRRDDPEMDRRAVPVRDADRQRHRLLFLRVYWRAGLYIVLSVAVSLCATVAGLAAARHVLTIGERA